MRKVWKVISIIGIGLVGVGCTKVQENEVNKQKVTINQEVVEQVAGQWYQEDQGVTPYQLIVKGKRIEMHTPTLHETVIVDETKDNQIVTHLEDSKKTTYRFDLGENELTILRSYRLDEGKNSKGGDLAPIVLHREKEITLNGVLGQWQSTEEDYPGYIIMRATFDPDKMELWQAQNEAMENAEISTLTLTKHDGESLTFMNEDESMSYHLSYYSNQKLLFSRQTNNEGINWAIRPYILERK